MSLVKKIIKRMLGARKERLLREERTRRWEEVKRTIDPEKMTFYPDAPRKSREEVLRELQDMFMSRATENWALGQTVDGYFMCGMDRVGVDPASFVQVSEYARTRNSCQSAMAYILSYKQVAAIYLRACGVRASCPVGLVRNGVLEAADNTFTTPLLDWLQAEAVHGERRYFVKPATGIQARDCFRLIIRSGEEGVQFLVNGEAVQEDALLRRCEDCIIEPLLVQHARLREISPDAVFPIRIRTIRKSHGEPEFLSAYMAIGWAESPYVNVTNGKGIGFAVNEQGESMTDGLIETSPDGVYGRRIERHPELGFPIKGFHVPMMKEAIELALKAHRALPGVHTVGWDIGILDDGPIVIEGNADWGVMTYQAITGVGEREFFEKWIKGWTAYNPIPAVYGTYDRNLDPLFRPEKQ